MSYETTEQMSEDYCKEIRNSKPLNPYEWEGIHIDAEIPSTGICGEEAQKQAENVLRLSREIRRLKHKCGEEVWTHTWQSKENQENEKQAFLSLEANEGE